MCTVCIANNINRNVYMYQNTRMIPTTGNARVLLFMIIRREIGGTGTGCLFQFTYCETVWATTKLGRCVGLPHHYVFAMMTFGAKFTYRLRFTVFTIFFLMLNSLPHTLLFDPDYIQNEKL